MWIFKGLLFLVLLFGLVFFLVANSQQPVDINFFGKTFLGISIYWVIGVCFLVGFATSFLIAAFREFRFHGEIRGLKKIVRMRDKEIAELRTLPLRETEGRPAVNPVGKEASGD